MNHKSLGIVTVEGGAIGTCTCGFTTGVRPSIMVAHTILTDHLTVSTTDGEEF